MAKKLVSLRLNGDMLDFVLLKSGCGSVQGSIDWLIGMYWDAYHPIENVFRGLGVPEVEVSKATKVSSDVKVKIEPKVIDKKEFTNEDGIISDIVKGMVVKYKIDDKGIKRRV